jgi:VanZ family protein
VLKKIALFAAIVWTAVIFFLCIIKSSELPSITVANLDKVAHAFFHLLFVILWFLYFKEQIISRYHTKAYVYSFSLSVFFGIAIEMMQQFFTTTRSADILDVVSNVAGAIVGIISIVVVRNVMNRDIV